MIKREGKADFPVVLDKKETEQLAAALVRDASGLDTSGGGASRGRNGRARSRTRSRTRTRTRSR
jgi:hypothetical protein